MIRAIAVWAGLSVSCAGAALAADAVTFQFSWIPTGDYAVYSAGVEKGFYKEAGIDLKVAIGRGSGDAIKKVASGAAQFGDGDIGSLMTARVNEGAPVKCVLAQHSQSPHAVFVLESSGIRSIKDLSGRTLATTAGNSHFLYFPFVARQVGLDPSTVKWTTVDASTMAPMLIAKRVDGAPLFATHAYYVGKEAQRQGEKLVVLPFADAGFKIYSYCIYATDELIAKNPDLVRRFVGATVKSFLWTRDHIDEAVAIHHRKYPDVAEDDAKGSLRIMYDYIFPQGAKPEDFGRFDDARLSYTYKVVSEAQGLREGIDATSFVDQTILPASAPR